MCTFLDLNNLSITGDCGNTNSGAISFNVTGDSPGFTIQWVSPSGGTTVALSPIDNYLYSLSGLSAGTYTFDVIDSCSPNFIQAYNIYISSGTCVNIDSTQHTTCGEDNGSIDVSISNIYGTQTIFYLYELSSGFITSTIVPYNTTTQFTNLSAGTYYVIGDNGGGCTGMSESCIVKDSSAFTYNLYVVENAGCAGTNSGAIYITDLNGVPPYTYSWNTTPVQTTSYITGLTNGVYGVSVTDSTGCVVSLSETVNTVPQVGLQSFASIQPSCFSSDGQLSVTISGGTSPYYFSGSNGNTQIIFGTPPLTYTFTNLGPGIFNVKVTDAGLCSFTASELMLNPNGFSVASITTTNSTCSFNNGSVTANIFGGTGTYTYSLSDGVTTNSSTTNSTTFNFNNLESGTYTLEISGGTCVYTTTVTINNNPLLYLNYNYTGETCDSCNGGIELVVSGGSGNYEYQLIGPSFNQTVPSSFSSYTFSNLCQGTYQGLVKDITNSNCTVSTNILLTEEIPVSFSLYAINPTPTMNNGTITAFIVDGIPPYILTWGPNVNGQTGITVTNLSAGTYSLTVEDSNGCVYTKTQTLNGYVGLSNYQVFNICESDFENTGVLLTKGPKQMLNEGFYDLTSGDTNCILNEAYFTAIVTVGSFTKSEMFYTGYNLNDYPSDELWSNTIENLLLSFDGITGVTTNVLDNQINITTPCYTLDGNKVKIDMLISYDINCQEIDTVTTTTTSP